MSASLKILMLEDVASDARLVEHELKRGGIDFEARRVQTRDEFANALQQDFPDLILADYSLPSFDGLTALHLVRARNAELPFIFVSGAIGEERAIEALRSGATDYVLKDRLSRLPQAVRRALAEIEERVRRRSAEEALRRAHADLQTAAEELEQRVRERTADLALANDALHRSESRLRRLVEANILGVMYADTAGRITEANEAFLDMVGYTRAEMLAGEVRWTDMTPREYAAADQAHMLEADRFGACTPYEKEYVHKDGRRVPIMIGYALLEDSHSDFTCFVLDLTARKQAEDALRQAHTELQQAAEELEERVEERTAELSAIAGRLRQANTALEVSRYELQTLSHLLVEVQESERRTIARELHDEAGQALTSIMVGLHLLEQETGLSTEARARIIDLKHTTEGVMEGLHRLAVNLRPASLDKLGLMPALRQYIEQFARQSGLEVDIDLDSLQGVRLPADTETALYRIVQEALANVARHARASNAGVVVTRRNGRVTAIVEDNGVGCDPADAMRSGRLGLLGMRERAEMLGGTLTIESTPGAGTTVFADVPSGEMGSGA